MSLTMPQGGSASESLQNLGSVWPDLGGLDRGQELLALTTVVAVVLVPIPVLFFGLELIILGVLLIGIDCQNAARSALGGSGNID